MFSAGQALIMNNLITGNTTGLNNGTTDAVGLHRFLRQG